MWLLSIWVQVDVVDGCLRSSAISIDIVYIGLTCALFIYYLFKQNACFNLLLILIYILPR